MSYWDNVVDISVLAGKIIKSIEGLESESDEVNIYTECGQHYRMNHSQDCCEYVAINDVESDVEDFTGAFVISAEEVSSEDAPEPNDDEYRESYTWTFYKIETNRGGVWIRWLGESNGYYAEDVDFRWVNKPDDQAS